MAADSHDVRRAPMAGVLVRPMRHDDIAAAERLSAEAFLEVDRAHPVPGQDEPGLRSPARAAQWVARTGRLLGLDPAGCWVADHDGEMAGFATSFRRETTWFLSTYAVRPRLQGRGLGRVLLDAALTHSIGCTRGMLAASDDPRAVRRYRLAGFDLHPQMTLTGRLDRSAIPPLEHLREGRPGDRDLMDSLDRARRGAGHGPDHEFLVRTCRLLVVQHSTGEGYAYLDDRGGVALLAASNRRTATRLLWGALAAAEGDRVAIHHVTAANQWALDVGLAVDLAVGTSGYLGLRGMRPPAPYLHHGSLL